MSTYEDASLIYYPSGVKAGKAYSLKPTDGSGDLTFTRASTATRVNAEGLIESVATGVPRIDYTGGGCGKLLLEPQRTNVILRSEEFDNAAWSTNNSSVSANTTTSPDGTTNADSLIEDTSNNLHQLAQSTTATGGIYTASIYVKANGRNWIALNIAAAGSYSAFFDIQNGVVGTIQANITSASITSVGNGWYRCVVVANTGAIAPRISISMSTGNNIFSYLGDGTSGVYLYGAQLELGSYSTSLIKTTSTAVTRVKDTSGTSGLSSLINSSEGTLYVEIRALANDQTERYITLNDGSNTNVVRIGYFVTNPNQILYQVNASGLQTNVLTTDYTISDFNKIAVTWKLNEFKLFINGVQVGATDTSGTPPIGLNTLAFGNVVGLNQPFYGENKGVMVFPTALSNAELETLTTL